MPQRVFQTVLACGVVCGDVEVGCNRGLVTPSNFKMTQRETHLRFARPMAPSKLMRNPTQRVSDESQCLRCSSFAHTQVRCNGRCVPYVVVLLVAKDVGDHLEG